MKRGFVFGLMIVQTSAIFCKLEQWLLGIFLLLIFFFVVTTTRSKNLLITASFIFILFMIYTPSQKFNEERVNQDISGSFSVKSAGRNYVIIEEKRIKYLIYNSETYEVGEFLTIKGKTASIQGFMIPNVETFKDYLNKQQIFYQIDITYIHYENQFNLRKFIKNASYQHLSETSQNFMKLMIYGDKSGAYEIYRDLQELSIVQLFVISGFHIQLLFLVLLKFFRNRFTPCLIVIGFYLYVLNFPVSALRAVLSIILLQILKPKHVTRIQILGLTYFCILMVNPLLLFSISFQLSMMASLALVLTGSVKWRITRPLFVSLYAQIFILPILVSIRYEIVPLSFIYNALLALPVSILFIGSWIVSVVKFFDIIYLPLVVSFNYLIQAISSNNWTLIIAKITPLGLLIYYLILLNIIYFQDIKIKKIRNLFLFSYLLLLFYFYQSPYIYSPASVSFLDVGQGDATLIKGDRNRYAILIDTGGSRYSDISQQRTIPFLKSLGIRSLDLVIITHDDFDHNGALSSLQNNFPTKQIITEPFNEITVNDLSIFNLNHYQDYSKEDNYNSLVIKFRLLNKTFLIMGDAPIEIENKIVHNNDSFDVDFLRTGHHGSKTSTSTEFLQHISPKVAIISVGKNNMYGHPHSDVIRSLMANNTRIYRTDLNGTICIKNEVSLRYLLNNMLKIVYNKIIVGRGNHGLPNSRYSDFNDQKTSSTSFRRAFADD